MIGGSLQFAAASRERGSSVLVTDARKFCCTQGQRALHGWPISRIGQSVARPLVGRRMESSTGFHVIDRILRPTRGRAADPAV